MDVMVHPCSDFKMTRCIYQLGTSQGRNVLMNEAKRLNYEYIFMSDDDYEIDSASLLPTMGRILIKEHADIVATARDDMYYKVENGQQVRKKAIGGFRNAGTLIFEGTTMTILPNVSNPHSTHKVTSKIAERNGCVVSDLVQQFFFAKLDTVLGLWDDKLTNSDHYNFLQEAKLKKLKMLVENAKCHFRYYQ